MQERLLTAIETKVVRNKPAIRSVAALFSSNITSSFLGSLGGLLAANFVGPQETGAFRFYMIPLMYLTFLHLGTFDGLWRQIPYYAGKNSPEKIDELASSGGAWNLYLSIVVSCGFSLCALYSLWHHDLYGVFGWLAPAFCCWGTFYGGYLSSTYRTLHQFTTMARIQLTQSILNFVMVFILPFSLFYGLCIRAAVPPIMGVWLFHKNRPLKIEHRFDAKPLKELIKTGFPFSFWGSLYTSVWTATESALMLSLGGITGLGLFSVAVALREGMSTLPQSIYQVLTPRVVTAYAKEESVRSANARSLWLTGGLVGFMVFIILIVSSLLEILVPLIIPKYAEGIFLMKICLWFAAVQAASLPLNTLFATGRSWLYGRGVIVGLVVFPLTTYLLIPHLGGILAVATGSLLGRAARTIAGYVELAGLSRLEV